MSYINQFIILQCGPPSLHYCTLPKKPFLPLQFGQEEIESLLIYFENFQGAPFSHWQSSNRIMNTFIIVKITPICR